jgi:arabinoxylan arabinofuranohydrolase
MALRFSLLTLATLFLTAGPVFALNPICPPGVYIADPEARQMPDGRTYVYGSRDEPGNKWCSRSYDVLSTRDLKTWNLDQMSFATDGPAKQTDYTDAILFAPDCVYKNGRYHLFYCLNVKSEHEGVAVADSPYGPFTAGKKFPGINGIDPAVLVDDDGQAYLYWGQNSLKCAKLTDDMSALVPGSIRDGLIRNKNSPWSEDTAVAEKNGEFWFHEGASIRKRNGVYYLLYAQHGRHGHGCTCLAYATAPSPTGPFRYRGVVIDSFGCAPNLWNNHGSITEINGRWYVFYHRPTHADPTGTMRKACVEPITFNADGSIDEVLPTTGGVDGPLDPRDRMDAARACLLSGNVRVEERRPKTDAVVDVLAKVRAGDTATWRFFDFDKAKVTRFTCRTRDTSRAAKIEIHLDRADGELLGMCDLPASRPSVGYSIATTSLSKTPTGKHALVLVAKSDESAKTDLFDLEWIAFDER